MPQIEPLSDDQASEAAKNLFQPLQPASAAVLINHVKTVIAEYDGMVGMDD